MSNMSYCRFQNTLVDLQDCYDNLFENLEGLSLEEKKARKQLIVICHNVAWETDFGEDTNE